MKRILLTAALLALSPIAAQAAGGFSCESDEKDPVKVVVEGATPRSEPGLINFGGTLEFDGKKIELKKSDVRSFVGRNGIIQVRVSLRAGEETHALRLDVKRDPKDEDEWPGTYEISTTPAGAKDAKAKTKPAIRRGKVKCFVE
jgi:hypothetical protein